MGDRLSEHARIASDDRVPVRSMVEADDRIAGILERILLLGIARALRGRIVVWPVDKDSCALFLVEKIEADVAARNVVLGT